MAHASDHDLPSAAQRVFGTVELLEHILLNVPLTNLFVLQRTNTTFKDTIDGSRRVKQRMFLETAPVNGSKAQWNPILESFFFKPKTSPFLVQVHACPKLANQSHLVNFRWFPEESRVAKTVISCHHVSWDEVLPAKVQHSPPRLLPYHDDTEKGVKESWREMLIAHSKNKVELEGVDWASTRQRFIVRMEDDEGMKTLGELFDWVDWMQRKPYLPLRDGPRE